MEEGRGSAEIRIHQEALLCTPTTSELHSIKGIVISSPYQNVLGTWHSEGEGTSS